MNEIDFTQMLLKEIGSPKAAQADIAGLYAEALKSGRNVDWRAINYAILDRWKFSGLERIKTRAWKRSAQ